MSVSSPPTVDEPAAGPRIAAETANQWTHAAGFVLSVCGAWVLLNTALATGDPYRAVGCGIYAFTLVALYAASTLSHSFAHPRRRSFFRMLDQVCIFFLIVGSYTPFGLVHARSGAWWLILAAMWIVALWGSFVRVRRPEQTLGTLIFVMLGWLPILAFPQAIGLGSLMALSLILGGGLAYTGGCWFLVNDHRHPYFHAVWHLFTMLGSTCHFLFLWKYVAAVG